MSLHRDKRHRATATPTGHDRSGLVRALLFLACCVAVWSVSRIALAHPENRALLEIAVTIDMTVFVPVLYWLILVRGSGWPAVGILPVFLLGVVVASLVLPGDRQAALDVIGYLALPAELVLFGLLAHRAVAAVKAGRAAGTAGAMERIRSAVRTAVPNRRAADMIAYEAAVLWFALLSWRSRTDSPQPPGRAFTHHVRTGYDAVVAVIILAIAVEIVPVHALLARLSPILAWAATALSAYGALWLIGDARAMKLRSTTLDADALTVRFGIRWTLDVPRDVIEAVEIVGGSLVQDPVDLRMSLPGARRIRVRLKRPVDATGPYGIRRHVGVFELGVDDTLGLASGLTAG